MHHSAGSQHHGSINDMLALKQRGLFIAEVETISAPIRWVTACLDAPKHYKNAANFLAAASVTATFVTLRGRRDRRLA
jgi:hypothetical protein